MYKTHKLWAHVDLVLALVIVLSQAWLMVIACVPFQFMEIMVIMAVAMVLLLTLLVEIFLLLSASQLRSKSFWTHRGIRSWPTTITIIIILSVLLSEIISVKLTLRTCMPNLLYLLRYQNSRRKWCQLSNLSFVIFLSLKILLIFHTTLRIRTEVIFFECLCT